MLQALNERPAPLRPDAIPLVMEFLAAWPSDQAAHADREPLEVRDEA